MPNEKTPEVEMKGADVLKVEQRPYTNKKTGNAEVARTVAFMYMGKLFRMSTERVFDINKAVAKEGKKGNIVLSVTTFGQSIEPQMRIVDIT